MFNKEKFRSIPRGDTKPNAHRFDKSGDEVTTLERLSVVPGNSGWETKADGKSEAVGSIEIGLIDTGERKVGRRVSLGNIFSDKEINRMDQIRRELQSGRRER